MGSRQSLGASSVGGNRGTRLPQKVVQKFTNYKTAVSRIRSTTIPRLVAIFKVAVILLAAIQLFQFIWLEVSGHQIKSDLLEIHEGIIARDQAIIIPFKVNAISISSIKNCSCV